MEAPNNIVPTAAVPSDAELRALIDFAPDGIFVVGTDSRLAFANAATCRLLGFTRDELLGAPIAELLPADDAAQIHAAHAKLPYGSCHVSDSTLRRKDGSQLPVEISTAQLPDGRWQGWVRDRSERLRRDAARERLADDLRASERLLRDVFDILPVGVWIADHTGRLVRHNPAGERIWGGALHVPIAEFDRYKGWWLDTGERITAEDWGMTRALTRGETSSGELVRIQSFDGTFKTIIHSAVPLRDQSGEITGAIVVNEDITALHEAQERQRASERLLRTVIDVVPVGIWLTDAQGRITSVNPAGARIWAGTRYVGPEQYSDFEGWSVDTSRPIAPDQWGLARAIRNGETSRAELIRIRAFDGSFKTVINWAAPIRSDAGEIIGAVAVNEDVTSFQHTQEQLRAAVHDREEILAIVAHDLRNPLQSIINYLRSIAASLDLPAEGQLRTLVAAAEDIAARMAGLVDDLLTVSVAGIGGTSLLNLAPVPAATLLSKAADAARPLIARAGLVMDIEVRGELPLISVDADKLLRVFANLLDNALKFTPPSGVITLGAETTIGGVRFSVANTGTALSDEERAAMFQPFWQGRRDERGAGLGLSICRSIVEAHGGTIWADPVEGKRVRVCVVLPRQPAVDSTLH